jgi:hypothetical protein
MCTALESLDLGECCDLKSVPNSKATDELKRLLKFDPELMDRDISSKWLRCGQFTEIIGCVNLKELNLRGCQSLVIGQRELQAHLPTCNILFPGARLRAQPQSLCTMPPSEDVRWEWDPASPLLDEIFKLSGKGNSVATKLATKLDFRNCLVTSRPFNSGIHRISFKLTGGRNGIYCGVAQDKASWNERHAHRRSTQAWFMCSRNGGLFGNGKERDHAAGAISTGQIITMEANVDSGTIRFWLDGKQHGPGYTSGATGKLRWAISLYKTLQSVQIVPTPELQPYSAASAPVSAPAQSAQSEGFSLCTEIFVSKRAQANDPIALPLPNGSHITVSLPSGVRPGSAMKVHVQQKKTGGDYVVTQHVGSARRYR